MRVLLLLLERLRDACCRVVRAMLVEGLQKTNKSLPPTASGRKHMPITKFVLVPSGLGLREAK